VVSNSERFQGKGQHSLPVMGEKEGNMHLHTHMVSIIVFFKTLSLTQLSDRDRLIEEDRPREPTWTLPQAGERLGLICGPEWRLVLCVVSFTLLSFC
jgi:hypothetical protein